MDKRLILFLIFSLAIFQAWIIGMKWWQGPPPEEPAEVAQQQGDEQPDPAAPDAAPAEDEVADDAAAPADEEPDIEAAPGEEPAQSMVEERWLTLGSLDPESPYKLLVTLTNRGAALARAELTERQFRDLEWRSGYLGHVEGRADVDGRGCQVHVVGPGTPAAEAGIQVGDILTALGETPLRGPLDLHEALAKTKPQETVVLHALRDGEARQFEVALTRQPLEVVRPEGGDPLSLLMTLQQVGDEQLGVDEVELEGVRMRTMPWEIERENEDEVVFLYRAKGLEIRKRYRLAQVKDQPGADPAYDLRFDISISNTTDEAQRVAYRLDGPTGLPTEGWWYANKISHAFFEAAGLRDIMVGFWRGGHVATEMVTNRAIATEDVGPPWRDQSIAFIGVDAQYFAAALLPRDVEPGNVIFETSQPVLAGPVPADKAKQRLTDITFRVNSVLHDLEPGEEPFRQEFTLFVGPKQPDVLAYYGLDDLVYYGWFGWVSRPMLAVLHFFHDYVTFGNYGLAIILLTVMVRSCMFPLSRKQALSAQKMQQLQPEMKRIADKYKNNMEARSRAQQELFKKHNYNPLGGCLLMFIQLPIFIGLYRSLSVDVELRQAPLISESIRWCSNLAAPDMLFAWPWMPDFVTSWLGPYFNILPLVTVGLFLWQQKMFLPPPTDDQTRMQQKIMQYMMLFMGIMFFKVASGLCLYFIASSLWGIAERKLLPKTIGPAPAPLDTGTPSEKTVPVKTSADGNGAAASRKKKQRRR